MSETLAETVLTRRSSAESRSWSTSTMSEALSAENSAGTTDEQTTDTRVLDLDSAKPAAIDGATAIFVPAYKRASGALRYDGDVVTHLIGVYSKGDARNALAGSYSSAEITQAFERGAWMEANHIENANAAIACVESPGAVADGGEEYPAFVPAPDHGPDFYRSVASGSLFSIKDTDPEKAARYDDGHEHNMILVTRHNEDGTVKRRRGYNSDGRYTYVDNTTYKCTECGLETGTTPRGRGECDSVATDGGTGRPDDCRCEEFDETVCPPCSMAGFDTRGDVESMTTVRSERANMGGGESTGVEEL